jgi:hypothetical protein
MKIDYCSSTMRGESPLLSGVDDESLDPENWDELRRLGHRMLEDMIEYLSTVRQRPAWQPVPPAVKKRLSSALPSAPQSFERVYEEFKRDVLPYPTGNIHPRFWGWVMGTGSPLAMLADTHLWPLPRT